MYQSEQSSKTFKSGDIIMRQGEVGQKAYIVESGKVEIVIETPSGEEHIIATRGPNAMIGEMSLIDDAPRTATIRATENCTVLEITKQDFTRRLNNADPVIRMATQVIMTRYRDTLNRIEAKAKSEDKGLSNVETMELIYAERADAIEQIRIANEFKDAMDRDNGEITLFYQPIINLHTGEIYGFEALMRWFHPEKGFISPGVFIPVIEETGQIIEASNWAFRKACTSLKHIQESTRYHKDLHMSVNFSSEDFSAPDFVDNIYSALSETDVKAEQIHLEITERLLIGQPKRAKETLSMCRKAGMGIAIDDFGTGYSSLNYLHTYPINTLKIDRSFIRDMESDKILLELVRSIVMLGHNMGMDIIAEGVETLQEAKILKEMGCKLVQGFYFAKPMAEKDVIELVSSWQPPEI
ncbi:MAG: EAL domain-containing protein [Alphaproteobacteria bacterium]|nr:EAL domain-containing protein [Alphaproteobacteria bacterium]